MSAPPSELEGLVARASALIALIRPKAASLTDPDLDTLARCSKYVDALQGELQLIGPPRELTLTAATVLVADLERLADGLTGRKRRLLSGNTDAKVSAGDRPVSSPTPRKKSGPPLIVSREKVLATRAELEAAGRPAGHTSIARALMVSEKTVQRRIKDE